ncbi:MAG TPA: DEAD/DEAH box helicase, partial [Accumulibacter sp.]|nr:DEAD/DEAH box helicase [Accumulibacter sp.]
MTFSDIGLHAAILRALTDAGYSEPTEVQRQTIPAAIEGRDLLVCSQTGSGKTAAFMLPALHRLAGQELPPATRSVTGNDRRASSRSRPRFE